LPNALAVIHPELCGYGIFSLQRIEVATEVEMMMNGTHQSGHVQFAEDFSVEQSMAYSIG